MAKSREIKKRIKAVKNIQRITRTMQMIATSKFAKAQQASLASKPYTAGLFDLVTQLASAADGVDHPLLSTKAPAGTPELTLVITSDRGLCGPYNANVIRRALGHLRENAAARDGRIELVGKKGLSALEFNRITVARLHTHIGDRPRYDDVNRLGEEYIEAFTTGQVSAVRVVSMKYISAGRQAPEILQLLPFSSAEMAATPSDDPADAGAKGPATLYEFSPSASELLGALVPAAAKAVLFQCFNDAIVSEHVARMVAMKAATDNAGKMGKSLKRRYNRARQSQITTELNEIIAGAAALS